jgi:preprotein translocase subunit SecE
VVERPRGIQGLTNYFQETQAELRKVVWPSREEAVNLTVLVLAVTLAMTIILGGIDWVFSTILQFILSFAN